MGMSMRRHTSWEIELEFTDLFADDLLWVSDATFLEAD